MLNNPNYIRDLQNRQAATSIGASTARRAGANVIPKARRFLMDLRLGHFHKRSETAFRRELDLATEELIASLPRNARRWGSARKFLNIMLRDCSYNKYLSTHYKLHLLEPWLEVPLDRQVATELKRIVGGGNLPPWRGVIHLTPEDSLKFQCFGIDLARNDGVNRVDLDVKFWRRATIDELLI